MSLVPILLLILILGILYLLLRIHYNRYHRNKDYYRKPFRKLKEGDPKGHPPQD